MSVLEFAAGFGQGYLKQRSASKEEQRIEEDRAMRKTEFDDRQAQVKQERALNVSLADASRPAMVEQGAGGMLAPATMDNRDVGLPENAALPNQGLSQAAFRVGGKEYATQAQADAAEKVYNGMDATAGRVGDAYMKAGKVGEAMQFKAGAQRAKADEVEAASKQWRGELGGAMTAGHDGIADFVTKNQGSALGDYQVKAVPSADGSQVVYNRVDKEGKLTPMPEYTFANNKDGVTQAGFFLDKTVTPEERYKVEAAQSNKAADRKALSDYRTGTLDVRNRAVDVQSELGDKRLTLQSARAASGGSAKANSVQSTRVDENGDMVIVMRDGSINRPMLDGKPVRANDQSAVNSMVKMLQSNPTNLMAPPEKLLNQARELVRTPQNRGGGIDTSGQAGILNQELAQAKQRLANGDPRAQGDIDSLGRELSRVPGGLASAKPAQKTAPSTGPKTINSAAERDALPRGTQYKAPNGQIYTKQ